jgi:hypothetical protein
VEEDGVSVYPNPTNNLFNIKISNPNVQIKKVVLTDISGKIIYSKNTKTINVTGFSKGLYFLSIETNTGKIITKKVVVN